MENHISQDASIVGHIKPNVQLNGKLKTSATISGSMTVPKVYREGVSTPATREELGLVMVGDNLDVTEDGLLSAIVPTKVSELENDSGFITDDDILVKSVNGKTGEVELNAEDIGAIPDTTKIPSHTSDLINDSTFVVESDLEPYAKSEDIPTKVSELDNNTGFITFDQVPVKSVNGKTGDITIDEPEPYELPIASSSKLGGVKPIDKTNDMTTQIGVDSDGSLWVHAVSDIESIGAEKVMFSGDMVFTEAFGKYKPSGGKVTIPSDGKSLKGLLLDAYSEDKNPSTTQPSVTITSSTAKSYEVGTIVSPAYVGSFNAGSYTYGPKTGVTVTSWAASNNVTSEKKTNQNGTFASYTVPDGSNYKITLSALYTDGVIPVTALGLDYPSGQIKGGTKSVTSGAITGYRNSFYGTTTNKTTETTSSIIRALAQKSNKALTNSNQLSVNIPVGALRVIIAYPATLRDVTSIKDVNGLNADITAAFSKKVVEVNGANNYDAIKYKVYELDFASPNDTANKYSVTI